MGLNSPDDSNSVTARFSVARNSRSFPISDLMSCSSNWSHRVISCPTLVIMRPCSANGGIGMGMEKRSSVSNLQVPCVERRTSRRTSGFNPFVNPQSLCQFHEFTGSATGANHARTTSSRNRARPSQVLLNRLQRRPLSIINVLSFQTAFAVQ
jgi:hypothetical protein